MDEIYFNQIFCASFGIKGKQKTCWKTREKVDQVIYWKKGVIAENPHKSYYKSFRLELSSKEIEILKLGLRHGVTTRPVELEMIAILEDISDQIKNAKVIKNDLSEQWIKIALRAFTFNFIDVVEIQFSIDGKRLTKWPNTLKRFVGNFRTNCLSVFDNFVGLALKGLKNWGRR